MSIAIGFIIFFVGLFLGTALNTIAYRIPRGISIFATAKCPYCDTKIRWFYLLPVLGYILQKGRCKHCAERISLRYLLTEILTATAWTLLYVKYGFSGIFAVYALATALLIILALIDLDIREVPHSILLAILVVGIMVFVLSFFDFRITSTLWWEYLIGAFIISLPLFIIMIITRGGIGGGDIKLMFCLGFLLGFKLTVVAFILAIILAALVAIIMMIIQGKSGKYQLQLVPFLAVGFLLSVLLGDYIIAIFA